MLQKWRFKMAAPLGSKDKNGGQVTQFLSIFRLFAHNFLFHPFFGIFHLIAPMKYCTISFLFRTETCNRTPFCPTLKVNKTLPNGYWWGTSPRCPGARRLASTTTYPNWIQFGLGIGLFHYSTEIYKILPTCRASAVGSSIGRLSSCRPFRSCWFRIT